MKKLFSTIILAASLSTAFAQETAGDEKVYRNEFGIDATGFVKQFLNFNQGQFYTEYTPTYILTYRRHFKCGNIRFAMGGNFSSEDVPPSSADDLNKYHKNSHSYDARIGWEFSNELSKRWDVFYGMDFRPGCFCVQNDAAFWNAGYANGFEGKEQIYGVAPVLGFSFKLTERIHLETEASFSFDYSTSWERKYYTPTSSLYPELPDETTPRIKKIYTSFEQPLALIFTFDI